MLKVIYEDNHILVVEKPCNVPSQADNTGDVDMMALCKDYLREKYNKPGNIYVGLVHRLDRPVGGIMVFAKTSKASSRLSESIRTKNFNKTYLAIVENNHLEEEGIFEDYMYKNEALNKSAVCSKGKSGAKLARLSYKIISTQIINRKPYSLVEINLETGRHHQIRVQFSSRKCPLYADQKYGNGPISEQIALWAYKVSFKHPVKDEIVTFKCNPPNEAIWKSFGVTEI